MEPLGDAATRALRLAVKLANLERGYRATPIWQPLVTEVKAAARNVLELYVNDRVRGRLEIPL